MVSNLHELLLLLFRNRSASAADLLRELNVEVPEYDEVHAESADLTDLRPAECRADLVLFLQHESRKVLGIIVEVQLQRDEKKTYAWPAYIANLHARHRCQVCLLVITVKDSVARWAGREIKVGPGTRCIPWVVGPSNTPVITEVEEAKKNVELAILSAIEHGNDTDIQLATRIALAAATASADIDAEHSKLYLDLLQINVCESARKAIEVTMSGALGFEYQSDFARRYIAQGKEEGRVEGKSEGRVEIVLKLLALRFGSLTDAVEAHIRGAQDAQIDAVVARALTAQTIDEALGPLR
jgi:hypothetical protein